jgi:hypothetical protein
MDNSLVQLAIFALTALPLVVQDRQSQSVSSWLLFATLAAWLGAGWAERDAPLHILGATAILTAGIVFLLVLPDRLGEADVLFAAGMACLLPFWTWFIAVVTACGGGLVAFGWLAWVSKGSIRDIPLAFLPCLYWGGITALLGEVLR